MEEAVRSLRAEVSLDCICPGWNDRLIMILIQKMTDEFLRLPPLDPPEVTPFTSWKLC